MCLSTYWNRYGISINAEYFIHLSFADDIVVMADMLDKLGTMLKDLNTISQQVDFKMNIGKTQTMSNAHVNSC